MSLSSPESLASPATPPALAAAHEVSVIASESAIEDSPVCVGQRVRFEADCILIPDPSPVSRMPRLVTKSYAVPLWRKRNQSQEPSAISDSETDVRDDEHVVFKVSVPSIAIRTRSPSRSEFVHRPLVPCLVHHHHHPSYPSDSPSTSVYTPRRPFRAASVPSSPRPIPSAQIVTIPLRPCCPDCVHSMDACLRQGAHWQEKFTRGALHLQRRASSSDARSDFSAHRRLYDTLPGFDSVVGSLAVDEVDKIGKERGARRLPAVPLAEMNVEEGVDGGLLPSLSRNASTSRLPDTIGRRPAKAPFHAKATSDSERPFFELPDFSPVDEKFASSLVAPGLRGRSVEALGSPALTSVHERQEPSIYARFRTDGPIARGLSSSPEPLPQSIPEPIQTSLSPQPPYDEVYRGPSRSQRRPSQTQRRPHLHLPAPSSFLKVGAEMLRGVTMSAGTPLSV
ncbi:uncharacterized protein C8Q71DRAFT_52815 [Rhodofomes roseus]|uniref:Uncharacterized protein n=1 Tax=Rhodofomes roseus TaxID=34475 RepID=A0ABQ8KFU3_9APHY|nr:uncharacterized protein C8Q71DRAFT_52815 [Rhodofomes roseus]KAH9836649.1 hypothetical protein C8Q71DRAFT_52815 [Rhodofomes roseus]